MANSNFDSYPKYQLTKYGNDIQEILYNAAEFFGMQVDTERNANAHPSLLKTIGGAEHLRKTDDANSAKIFFLDQLDTEIDLLKKGIIEIYPQNREAGQAIPLAVGNYVELTDIENLFSNAGVMDDDTKLLEINAPSIRFNTSDDSIIITSDKNIMERIFRVFNKKFDQATSQSSVVYYDVNQSTLSNDTLNQVLKQSILTAKDSETVVEQQICAFNCGDGINSKNSTGSNVLYRIFSNKPVVNYTGLAENYNKQYTVTLPVSGHSDFELKSEDTTISVQLKHSLKYQTCNYDYEKNYSGSILQDASDSIIGSYTATLCTGEDPEVITKVLCLTIDAAKVHFRLFTTEGNRTVVTNNTFDYKKVNDKLSLYETGTGAFGLATLANEFAILTDGNKVIGAVFNSEVYSFVNNNDILVENATGSNPVYSEIQVIQTPETEASLPLGGAAKFWVTTEIDKVTINDTELAFSELDSTLKATINAMVRLYESPSIICTNYAQLAKPITPIYNPTNNLVYCFHGDLPASQADYKIPFDRKFIYKIERPDSSNPANNYLLASGEVIEKFDKLSGQSLPALFYLEPGDKLTIKAAASFYQDSEEIEYIHTEYNDSDQTDDLTWAYELLISDNSDLDNVVTEATDHTGSAWEAEDTLELSWPPITIEVKRDAAGEWHAAIKEPDNTDIGEDI